MTKNLNEIMFEEIIRLTMNPDRKTKRPPDRYMMSTSLREMMVEIIDNTIAKYKIYYGGKYPDYVDVNAMRDYMLTYTAQTWKGFDCTKSENPWAFFTQIARGNISWFMSKEKYKMYPNERDLKRLYDRAMEIV